MMNEYRDSAHAKFWQFHSLHYLEMAFRTDKQQKMENPDGYGKRKGECGDTIEMFIRVRDKRIENITFHADGCMNTVACSNTAAMMAEGKPVDEAWEISPEKITEYLETLPPDEKHCAELAAGALYLALSDYRERKKSSWKKFYPR